MDTFYIYDIVYVINPRKMFCLKPRLCFFVFPAVLQVVVSSLSSQTASRTSSTPVLAAKRTSAPSRRSDPGSSAVTGGCAPPFPLKSSSARAIEGNVSERLPASLLYSNDGEGGNVEHNMDIF